jgi:reverse gyrase
MKEVYRLKAVEKRVLRRIFRLKRDRVSGSCRKLHNEDLHNLYSSPSIIKMMLSRRVGLAGRVASMGRKRMHRGYWWESQKENVSCMTSRVVRRVPHDSQLRMISDQGQQQFTERTDRTDQPEGKKSLRRPRRKRKDNTKLGPRERLILLRIGTSGGPLYVDNNEPAGFIKCWKILE